MYFPESHFFAIVRTQVSRQNVLQKFISSVGNAIALS